MPDMERELEINKAMIIGSSNERDHILGPTLSAQQITLLEYGDFEDRHSAEARFILSEILEKFENEVLFVWRHFPLREIHPHAQKAAEASEIAATRDKFWEMHEILLTNQQNLTIHDLTAHLSDLGFDWDFAYQTLNSGMFKYRVERDVRLGRVSGVHATPTFFLNGKKLTPPYTLKGFEKAINNAIKEDAKKI